MKTYYMLPQKLQGINIKEGWMTRLRVALVDSESGTIEGFYGFNRRMYHSEFVSENWLKMFIVNLSYMLWQVSKNENT